MERLLGRLRRFGRFASTIVTLWIPIGVIGTVTVVLKKPVALTAAVANTAPLSHLRDTLPGKNLLPAIMMLLLTPTLVIGSEPVAVKSVRLPNMFPAPGSCSDAAGASSFDL